MSSWFHSVSGLYFPDSQTIGLDYGNLLLDPEEAQLTLSHETVHSTITQTTDYGQASSIIYAVVDNMNHLTHMDKKEIKALLIEQQLDVQEAFATLIEGLMIKNKHGKLAMLAWAELLPTKYAQWLGGVQFVTDWSKKQRELFTSEISYVSFETGARREIPKLNLLANKQKFLEYLNQADNNPNMRFNKLCELLRYKNWLITKSYPDLCKLAGIKYHKPTTKADAP